MMEFADIIHLNVGGKRFSTSRRTLTWIPDSFFSCMLSGRIASLKDETGAYFIDRDPEVFTPILNYLRTKELNFSGISTSAVLHEAQFYGITPIVRRLSLCNDLFNSACGDLMFIGYLNPPDLAINPSEESVTPRRGSVSSLIGNDSYPRIMGIMKNAISEPNMKFDEVDPRKVLILRGHHNLMAVAYAHCVCCYRLRDSIGWEIIFTSPYLEDTVEKISLNAKIQGSLGDKMVAIASGSRIKLYSCTSPNGNLIGTFNLTVPIDALSFVGSQFVALSYSGKIGVWNVMTQSWRVQDIIPISSHDIAGSFLLLGGESGVIYYVDMEKFPLRMKDNDLLVTELFKDPSGDSITALSVYLTPRTTFSGNWIEIAYGTSSGAVRVIVHHPETVSSGPQLFQTFTVHRSPVVNVTLSEKHLISVCSEYNHVRTWSVTRFRGMVSTQPGPTALASFNVCALEHTNPHASYSVGNNIGPHGDRDEHLLFVQKVVPDTDQIFVRLAATGKRLMSMKSVDGSRITSFEVHECDASTRMGSRPRRFLFTGHSNGSIQMWDLTTSIERALRLPSDHSELCGPSEHELLQLLDQCDLSSSRCATPLLSGSEASFQMSLIRSQLRPHHSLTSIGTGFSIIDHKSQSRNELEIEMSLQSSHSAHSAYSAPIGRRFRSGDEKQEDSILENLSPAGRASLRGSGRHRHNSSSGANAFNALLSSTENSAVEPHGSPAK